MTNVIIIITFIFEKVKRKIKNEKRIINNEEESFFRLNAISYLHHRIKSPHKNIV